jgi:cytochrome b6-f complex iron-sulfur subunit
MIAGFVRTLYPNALYERSRRFKVGYPSDFPEDSITNMADERIVIYNVPGEGLYAMSAVCTHLGCVVQESENGLFCPCHGSLFDQQGRVKAGPAPRALPWHRITMSFDGQLVVDSNEEIEPGEMFKI